MRSAAQTKKKKGCVNTPITTRTKVLPVSESLNVDEFTTTCTLNNNNNSQFTTTCTQNNNNNNQLKTT